MSVPQITATQLSEPGPGKPLFVLGASLGTSVEALWGPAVPLLADHAHLIGWDLPGHGRSPSPTEPFTVGELADAVAALLAAQRAGDVPGADTRRAYYAGVSLAGGVALELGLRHPGAVDGLAVICSGAALGTPESWHERAATVRAQGTPALVSGSVQRWFSPGFLDRSPEIGSDLLTSLSDADDEGYSRCCEALAEFDVTDRLGRITDPVLVISGVDDGVAPPETGAAVASGVARGRAVVLSGVAHLAPAEDPEETARLVLDLLGAPDEPGLDRPTGGAAGTGDAPAAGGADDLTRTQVREAGMAVRREVLGNAHVEGAGASITDLTRDFQAFITEYAWGTIWTRPGLDRVTRSAMTLTALIAGGHDDELAMHVRAALRNGMTREQLAEVLLQSAIYCSVPSANTAFKVAQRVLAELDADDSSDH